MPYSWFVGGQVHGRNERHKGPGMDAKRPVLAATRERDDREQRVMRLNIESNYLVPLSASPAFRAYVGRRLASRPRAYPQGGSTPATAPISSRRSQKLRSRLKPAQSVSIRSGHAAVIARLLLGPGHRSLWNSFWFIRPEHRLSSPPGRAFTYVPDRHLR